MTADRPLAVFRADAGAGIGGGHVVRCLGLAAALTRDGWRCVLATARATALAGSAGESVIEGVVEIAGDEAASLRRHWPDGCDLLVVDHYDRDAAFESACRPWARRIVVVDDLADRRHDCDVLVDPGPGRTDVDYDGLAPDGCTRLLGPDYLTLRPEFAALRRRVLPRPIEGTARRILVGLGTMPPAELLDRVLGAVDPLGDISIDLAVSAEALPRYTVDRRVDVHVDTADMAGLMARADLAIGAGGVSSWERCCLGLPTVLLVLADNQRRGAAMLGDAGAVRTVEGPATASALARAVEAVADDPGSRAGMSRAAARLCDGLGAERVAMALGQDPHARDGRPVRLRPVTMADADTLLEWQRHPATRRFARNSAVPERTAHLRWLGERLDDPRSLVNLILHDGAPAGVVRLDLEEDCRGYEVSISVAPDRLRLGIARAGLALARRLVPDAELRAYVKPENAASIALFRQAGYRSGGQPDWYVLPASDGGGAARKAAAR